MNAEWVIALGTVGTFVVIAASAAAALMQLRHMRGGNQIALFTGYNAEFDSPEFAAAFAFVRQELPARVLTPEELQALATGSFPGELHAIRQVANLFEDMGAFVFSGVLHKDIVCNLFAANVLDAWQSTAPVVNLVRVTRGRQQIWENFEYLAALSKAFIDDHPYGLIPRRTARMPADDTLVRRFRELPDDARVRDARE